MCTFWKTVLNLLDGHQSEALYKGQVSHHLSKANHFGKQFLCMCLSRHHNTPPCAVTLTFTEQRWYLDSQEQWVTVNWHFGKIGNPVVLNCPMFTTVFFLIFKQSNQHSILKKDIISDSLDDWIQHRFLVLYFKFNLKKCLQVFCQYVCPCTSP